LASKAAIKTELYHVKQTIRHVVLKQRWHQHKRNCTSLDVIAAWCTANKQHWYNRTQRNPFVVINIQYLTKPLVVIGILTARPKLSVIKQWRDIY